MSAKDRKNKRLRAAAGESGRQASLPQAAVVIGLPALPDFSHANIESVTVGPRRAITMEISPLIWVRDQGHYGPPFTVRLGGIVNFDEVSELFAANHHKRSELAWLRYAMAYISKPGEQYLDLIFERVEARIVIHCQRVTVNDPPVNPREN